LPAVPAPVIWQTPAAWAATLRQRRSSAVMLVVARSLQPRRSEMEMLAEASCVVEETELCSEGPALGICSSAQAAAFMREGAELRQCIRWRVLRRALTLW
jgi:hypothetical protein